MKTFLATAAASLVLALTASADWVMESKIESPQMNGTTVIKMKGDKLRTDMTGGPMGAMSAIIDISSGELIQLIHSQKMAMKMSGEQVKQATEIAKQGMKGAGKTDPASAPKPQPTGKTEKIGNYECEIWTWTDGSISNKYWIAKNHPYADALKTLEKKMRSGALRGVEMGADISSLSGPALKTETTIGAIVATQTILSIKEENVDAKDFELPAGYNLMAMPALPGAK